MKERRRGVHPGTKHVGKLFVFRGERGLTLLLGSRFTSTGWAASVRGRVECNVPDPAVRVAYYPYKRLGSEPGWHGEKVSWCVCVCVCVCTRSVMDWLTDLTALFFAKPAIVANGGKQTDRRPSKGSGKDRG